MAVWLIYFGLNLELDVQQLNFNQVHAKWSCLYVNHSWLLLQQRKYPANHSWWYIAPMTYCHGTCHVRKSLSLLLLCDDNLDSRSVWHLASKILYMALKVLEENRLWHLQNFTLHKTHEASKTTHNIKVGVVRWEISIHLGVAAERSITYNIKKGKL